VDSPGDQRPLSRWLPTQEFVNGINRARRQNGAEPLGIFDPIVLMLWQSVMADVIRPQPIVLLTGI
jgi:hypothetical protein